MDNISIFEQTTNGTWSDTESLGLLCEHPGCNIPVRKTDCYDKMADAHGNGWGTTPEFLCDEHANGRVRIINSNNDKITEIQNSAIKYHDTNFIAKFASFIGERKNLDPMPTGQWEEGRYPYFMGRDSSGIKSYIYDIDLNKVFYSVDESKYNELETLRNTLLLEPLQPEIIKYIANEFGFDITSHTFSDTELTKSYKLLFDTGSASIFDFKVFKGVSLEYCDGGFFNTSIKYDDFIFVMPRYVSIPDMKTWGRLIEHRIIEINHMQFQFVRFAPGTSYGSLKYLKGFN